MSVIWVEKLPGKSEFLAPHERKWTKVTQHRGVGQHEELRRRDSLPESHDNGESKKRNRTGEEVGIH